MKPLLYDYYPEELAELLAPFNLKGFRLKQVNEWLSKCVSSFSQMSNLPNQVRLDLEEAFDLNAFEDVTILKSKLDDTRKYFFTLRDGEHVEAVLLHYHHGYSVCVSTQAGCKMGCKFCASATCGFGRDLTSGEILSELCAITRDMRENDPTFRIGHIVLMGIGEPLDNYDNVLKFIRLSMHTDRFGIGARNISLSTCGLVPEIYRLADENIPLTLSISLHAPTDEIRDSIMPINHRHKLGELLQACRDYDSKTGRRISFEYALMEGKNDSVACAEILARLLKGLDCHVNVIPINEVPGAPFRKVRENQRELFTNTLEKCKINVTVRRTLGADIEAACGQLRRKAQDQNN